MPRATASWSSGCAPPKRPARPAAAQPVPASKDARFLSGRLDRVILAALVNHPDLLLEEAERLAGMSFEDPDLDGFARALVDAIGDEPIWHDGAVKGWVTSGGYAHGSQASVAMGYVRIDLAAPGTTISADVRGRSIGMTVTKLPFVEKRSSKG